MARRRRSRSKRRGRRIALPKRRTILFAFGVIVALATVGWFVDDIVRGADIARGVTVADVDLSRLDRGEAEAALDPIADALSSTRVTLLLPDTEVEASAADLGVSVDRTGTVESVSDRGRFILRPLRWIQSLRTTRHVEPLMTVDLDRLTATMAALGVDPEFPNIELVGEIFQARDTNAVPAPDLEQLAQLLADTIPAELDSRVSLVVPMGGLVAYPSELADRLATEANALTANDAVVRLQGSPQQFRISRALLRAWVVVTGTSADPTLGLDEAAVSSTLNSLFTGIGVDGEPAVIGVDEDFAIEITGGEPGFECCATDAASALLDGLEAGSGLIVIPGEEVPHPAGREWAESLGITEVVGEFTTEFVAGQSRVTNIARISELTRGAMIEPGGTFSVNEFVGQRTREKGFVSAGVIYNGVFREDVGGGISQYATTLFNAAFFAGLDFATYQSHTIYISRYPYGREATLSYPRPDLEIINTTPYTLLLWPTTTDTSITVRFYSTPYAVGEQTDQFQRSEGAACTRVTTERTRTYLEDGRTEVDTVTARYRPEGVACDGSPTITTTTSSTTTTTTSSTTTSTTTTTTTTTAPPTTTTTAPPTTTTTAPPTTTTT